MSEPHQPPAQPYGAPPQFPGTAPQPRAGAQYPTASPGTYPGSSSGLHPGAHSDPHSGSGHPAPASGGSLGRVAFIIALVALGIGLLITLSFPVTVRLLSDTSAIGAFSAIGNLIVLVAAVVALILGLMSVRRPGQQILAGIAIGISASAIAGIVMSWISNLVLALTYA